MQTGVVGVSAGDDAENTSKIGWLWDQNVAFTPTAGMVGRPRRGCCCV